MCDELVLNMYSVNYWKLKGISNVSSASCSAILEIIPWKQNAHSLLYQPRHRDESSTAVYA